MQVFIITLSRLTGSLGNKIAQLLAKKLGFNLITRDYVIKNWLPEIATDHELHMLKETSKFYNKTSKKGITFAEYIENKLKEVIKNESVVIRGLGSQVIFRNNPKALHLRIVCSKKSRYKRLAAEYGLKKEQAQRTLKLSDRRRRRYVWRIYEKDWSDPALYHLCFNTDGIKPEIVVESVVNLVDLTQETSHFPALTDENESSVEKNKYPDFAHASEKEFVKILDMHNIKWDYEPTEFPLEWDVEGKITMGFRPDFYLPEFDTYIELTTMKQKYVTEKNKKKRLLQKLYPDININIVYKKDYHSLIERFTAIKGEENDYE